MFNSISGLQISTNVCTVLKAFKGKFGTCMFALKCRCARHIWDSGGMCVAIVTAYVAKIVGKSISKYNLSHMLAFKRSHH